MYYGGTHHHRLNPEAGLLPKPGPRNMQSSGGGGAGADLQGNPKGEWQGAGRDRLDPGPRYSQPPGPWTKVQGNERLRNPHWAFTCPLVGGTTPSHTQVGKTFLRENLPSKTPLITPVSGVGMRTPQARFPIRTVDVEAPSFNPTSAPS